MKEEFSLKELREGIDKIDGEMAELLQKRLDLVMKIAACKKSRGLPLKDAAREKQVLSRAERLVEKPEYSDAVRNVMREIIEQACALEKTSVDSAAGKVCEIGCFGSEGSFTHQALEDFFADRPHNRHHYNTFEEVISHVSAGALDYGVLPIENSSTGGITEVYDLLRKYDCHIVGEQQVKIEHNLIGVKGADINRIRTVYSHPQAFEQSKEFLKDHPQMERVPFFSTSRSAQEVAEKKDPSIAAIAGAKAAELYGLDILAGNINYNSYNYTRFVIVSGREETVPDADKITLIFAVKHETGSLYKMLASFYHTGLNLLNLESRPMGEKSWEYFFYIDVSGNLSDPVVIDLMEEIKEKSTYCKILGNYRASGRKE